jgi:hypothetical protein
VNNALLDSLIAQHNTQFNKINSNNAGTPQASDELLQKGLAQLQKLRGF